MSCSGLKYAKAKLPRMPSKKPWMKNSIVPTEMRVSTRPFCRGWALRIQSFLKGQKSKVYAIQMRMMSHQRQ